VVNEIQELLNRNWMTTLNYAHRPINVVAAVLALIMKEQLDTLVVHYVPPSSLQTALELDEETVELKIYR